MLPQLNGSKKFLQAIPSAYVVISHDRYFLDRACNRIIDLENGPALKLHG